MGRTPSAWLRPHSNRIALRVTTNSDPDVGTDSQASFAAGTWSHVAFTFDNSPRESFFASIFVNGTLDVSVGFSGTNVLGNDGPLHIGRDPSNLGARLVPLHSESISADVLKLKYIAAALHSFPSLLNSPVERNLPVS